MKESGDGFPGQMGKDSSPLAASFRCGTPVIFAPGKREGSAYLLAEAPKFLIGYYAEFSNDRDLKNRRRTSEISKCMFDVLVPFMDELICGEVTFVLAPAFIR